MNNPNQTDTEQLIEKALTERDKSLAIYRHSLISAKTKSRAKAKSKPSVSEAEQDSLLARIASLTPKDKAVLLELLKQFEERGKD